MIENADNVADVAFAVISSYWKVGRNVSGRSGAIHRHQFMNYCNARYANDGQLSLLDVEALQFLYGKR